MPKPRTKESIRCQYFLWLLGRRGTTYVADGRSNKPSAGRHSLGTTEYKEALANVHELDRVIAVKLGLAERSILQTPTTALLPLAEGRRRYEDYIRRPPVARGPAPSSAKRYRPVLDKFLKFAAGKGTKYWNEVDRNLLERYAAWLDGEGYAYATEFLELNTIKQVVKFFTDNEHLSADNRIVMSLRKPEGTDTYCWRPEEVRAMVQFCEDCADSDMSSWACHARD